MLCPMDYTKCVYFACTCAVNVYRCLQQILFWHGYQVSIKINNKSILDLSYGIHNMKKAKSEFDVLYANQTFKSGDPAKKRCNIAFADITC